MRNDGNSPAKAFQWCMSCALVRQIGRCRAGNPTESHDTSRPRCQNRDTNTCGIIQVHHTTAGSTNTSGMKVKMMMIWDDEWHDVIRQQCDTRCKSMVTRVHSVILWCHTISGRNGARNSDTVIYSSLTPSADQQLLWWHDGGWDITVRVSDCYENVRDTVT